MGVYLKAAGLTPGIAFVSPARRAMETFQEIERLLATGFSPIAPPLLYNARMSGILALLAEAPPAIGVLLVVGHNPGLAETANFLARSGKREEIARLRSEFPAPSLAVIDFDAAGWREASHSPGRLNRFVTPAALPKKFQLDA